MESNESVRSAWRKAGALLGRQGLERAKGGAGRKGMALAAFAIGLLAIFGALASTITDKLV